MAKDTNFKFGTHDPRQSPDMTPEKNSRKGAGSGSRDPNFLGIKCHSSKMAKGANFKFGTHDPRQSPDMTPEKNSRKGGRVT